MHHLRLLGRGGSSLGRSSRHHLSRRSSNRGSGSGRYGTTLTSFPCAGLGVPQVSQELGVHLQRSKQNKTMRSKLRSSHHGAKWGSYKENKQNDVTTAVQQVPQPLASRLQED